MYIYFVNDVLLFVVYYILYVIYQFIFYTIATFRMDKIVAVYIHGYIKHKKIKLNQVVKYKGLKFSILYFKNM